MLSVQTKYFGILSCHQEDVFEFPSGLPAFEEEKRFVPIQLPENDPLVFLQSLTLPTLCFLAFPIMVVDREYRLAVSAEDLAALGLDCRRQPELGREVLVLALVSLRDGLLATANLMAPLVLNLKTRRGLQAIRQDRAYSHQHTIDIPSPEVAC